MKFSLKAAAAAAMLALPALASAQTYTTYVGYADGLRGPATFPNPWDGSPLVQFFFGFTGSDPDAGAIMIQNTGGSALSISSIVYTLAGGGGFSYDFSWALPSPISLDPGKFAIFTGQDNVGDFDTSDDNVGPCGSPNTNDPHLDITVGGTTTGYNDSGHILDTGGVDEAGCDNFNRGGNESQGWTVVGNSNPTGQNNVAPEPSTIILTGSGLAGLVGFVRRRRSAQAE